ncbi:MAG TPA: hypothetical protein VMP08_22370 [Anaerolineae bacterium]|nr:hypothetical protein [Anaerolineae bacterium]
MADSQSKGLTCPACSSTVPVPEGARLVTCPSCRQRLFVQGDRGVRRWQLRRVVTRDQAQQTVLGFFNGMNKAGDLKRKAEVKELFLVYLPFWRVMAYIAGWRLGRVRRDKDSTKPVEVEVLEEMQWNDAAVDVSEFGVNHVPIAGQHFEPFDQDRLSAEGMVFEAAESPTDAIAEADTYFQQVARSKKSLSSTYLEKFHMLRQRLSLVYYPLWVARYQYRNRSYQVVIDGVNNKVLYGKAPGNILYRAGALVLGMAVGNLLLVQGTVFALRVMSYSHSNNDKGWAILLVPPALGILAMIRGYRSFRYGEEVEQIDREARKVLKKDQGFNWSSMISDSINLNQEVKRWLE